MNILKSGYYLLIISCVLFSCKAYKYKKTIQTTVIIFGNGGGFTGAVDEYILKGTGELYFKKAFEKDSLLIKKLDNNTLIDVFTKKDTFLSKKIYYNNPGNMNYYIKILENGKMTSYFVWHDHKLISPLLKRFNELLYSITSA